jgi:hypothetical protein
MKRLRERNKECKYSLMDDGVDIGSSDPFG